MVITRENLIKYWASGPRIEHQEGYINLNQLPFPDVETLSPTEKSILRDVIKAHPEYLLEIWCNEGVQ